MLKKIRRWGSSLLIGLLAWSLSGCASLPTSGAVHDGQVGVRQHNPLSQRASGPIKDSSPEKLLSDFQQACAAGTYDNFAAAKMYLTTSKSAQWDPDLMVTVLSQSSGLKLSVSPDNTEVTGTGNALLEVGLNGLTTANDAEVEVSYQLEQVDGQWRISQLPDGIFLGKTDFQNAYTRQSVYFWTPDYAVLVSDPRWLPRKNLGEALIEALLKGPSPSLSKAVETLLLSDQQQTFYQQKGNLVRINLPDDISFQEVEADPLGLFYQQIGATLSVVPGISSVELRVGETSYEFSKLSQSNIKRDGSLIGIYDGKVVKRAEGYTQEVTNQSYFKNHELTWPAQGGGEDNIRVVIQDSNLLMLMRERGNPVLLVEGTSLIRPTVDYWGWIWTAGSMSPNDLRVVDQNGTFAEVKSPWEDLGTIVHLALNSQGTRGISVRETASGQTTEIFTIQRDQSGMPVALINRMRVYPQISGIISAQWVSDDTVAVLSAGDEENVGKLVTYGVNSYAETLSAPKDALALLGEAGDDAIYLVTASKVQYQLIGKSNWKRVGSQMSYPSFIGDRISFSSERTS